MSEMRELPILLPDGTLDDCTVGIVQACMMYPDDLASIEEDVSAYRMRAITGFRDTQLGRWMNADFRSSKQGGAYAGQIIFTMSQFSQHRPDLKISFNKAAHCVTLGMFDESPDHAKNKSTVKAYWSEYKNSAHLWAALLLLYDQRRELPIDFVSLVTIADKIAQRADGLVAEWSPWRAPQGFPFDASIPSIEAPPPDAIARVESYRAVGK